MVSLWRHNIVQGFRTASRLLLFCALTFPTTFLITDHAQAANQSGQADQITVRGTVPLTPYFIAQIKANSSVTYTTDQNTTLAHVIVRGPANTLLRNHTVKAQSSNQTVTASTKTDTEGTVIISLAGHPRTDSIKIIDSTYPEPIILDKTHPVPTKAPVQQVPVPLPYFLLMLQLGIVEVRKKRNADSLRWISPSHFCRARTLSSRPILLCPSAS